MTTADAQAVFALVFAALIAGPYVTWVRGGAAVKHQSTLQWPPERPEGLDRRYRYDSRATKFETIGGAVVAVSVTQLLWSASAWWVIASAWVVVGLRSAWLWRLIRADGGLARARNLLEKILLWCPLGATLLMDLTVVLSTAWHLLG